MTAPAPPRETWADCQRCECDQHIDGPAIPFVGVPCQTCAHLRRDHRHISEPRSWDDYLTDRARHRLSEAYQMDNVRQDPNGTWWVGSMVRPDLLNMNSLTDAVAYLDRLPPSILNSLSQPRGEHDHG